MHPSRCPSTARRSGRQSRRKTRLRRAPKRIRCPARRATPERASRRRTKPMSLRINTNIEAMDAHRQLMGTQDKLQKSMERLSSGYRINTAADDAAGLAISEKLRAQISGLDQANRNTSDAISLVQTAEGQLNEVHSMLQRVRELAVEYKNGTLSTQDQTATQSEITQLACEIERIGTSAQFNNIPLLNGAVTITFQVGANDGETTQVTTATLYGSAIPTAAFNLSA